ncbi:MAG TPA: hypothetical protein VD735_03435 [Candidatus Saccharimonadales bacterium]|nr:hypothetical protein [Candidatus Saccharimonadales bacterium]
MKHPITTTHNGAEVYVNLVASLAGTTISQQPHLANLVKEVLSQTRVDKASMYIEQDMQRPIGYDAVVPTGADATDIFYAKMVHDKVYSRFIKRGKPQATNYLSIVLYRDSDGAYELTDVWIGKQRPARPGSPDETPASFTYWANHAFALEGHQVQPRTLTRTCPYENPAAVTAGTTAQSSTT